jgi:hypothetical protein
MITTAMTQSIVTGLNSPGYASKNLHYSPAKLETALRIDGIRRLYGTGCFSAYALDFGKSHHSALAFRSGSNCRARPIGSFP